ncbi:MAG: HDOD domain-containing protein [Deltaproteobacteria bacterium]|nr:HDOD domain-containing protein [Deltaproteobacteria bacterium]
MFGRLFGSSSKDSSNTGTRKLSPAITSSILSTVGTKSIPSMPGAAQKAFKLATDPSAEARDFIEVIESDEALSARVLKIANSVFFDRGKPSQTIEESVLVIGMNELRCLLNATSLCDIFPSKHPARGQFWANDVATALIARGLAERLLPAKSELAFLAGLMHDVGKLLLLQRASEGYSKVMRAVEDKAIDYQNAEIEEFPFDHTEVGQLIGERWNFGPDLIAVIRNHHTPWKDLNPHAGEDLLTCIVKGADIFAHALGLGHLKGMAKFKAQKLEECEGAFEALKIPVSDRKQLLARFQKTFEVEYDLYAGNSAR